MGVGSSVDNAVAKANAGVARIAKFLVAIAGGAVTTVTTFYPSTLHWFPALIAAITAVAVYLVPNASKGESPNVSSPTL